MDSLLVITVEDQEDEKKSRMKKKDYFTVFTLLEKLQEQMRYAVFVCHFNLTLKEMSSFAMESEAETFLTRLLKRTRLIKKCL